ncbi:hypothetical protein KCP75_19420 [Salmonella enterica subsp. enterica]|nr:hypothetical protein KCP75_19420 [Salmonella enterica subsp. enterica]
MLPKDFLRLRIDEGVFASDMADAAGTMWLDVKRKRDWSDVSSQRLSFNHDSRCQRYLKVVTLPERCCQNLASAWGIPAVPVVAGGGDNAAGAVGVGNDRCRTELMLSPGTSGVYFA